MKRLSIALVLSVLIVFAGSAYASTPIPDGPCDASESGKAACAAAQSGHAQYATVVCDGSLWTGDGGVFLTREECVADCSSRYGANCLDVSQTPGGIQIQFTGSPVTITPPETSTLTWSVTGADVIDISSLGNNLPPTGTRIVNPTITTTYILTATKAGVTSQQQSVTIQISESGTDTVTGDGCCATKSGDTWTYAVSTAAACNPNGDNILFRPGGQPSACQALENRICPVYCQEQSRRGGRCTTDRFGASSQDEFYPGICDSQTQGLTKWCQCGGIDTSAQRRNEPCSSACLTSNRYGGFGASAFGNPFGSGQSLSIPTGVCTDNPQSLVVGATIVTQTQAGSSYTRQPYPAVPGGYGDHGCDASERCWCVTFDFGSSTQYQSPPTTLPGATIPGTGCTQNWCPPDMIQDAPQKQPNDRRCDIAVNATIEASFGSAQLAPGDGGATQITGLRLIQAGEPVTIVGHVTKLADHCAGYSFTCREQRELTCEGHNNYFWATYEYQDCPREFPEKLHEEGEGRRANWRAIVDAVGVIAATATGNFQIAGMAMGDMMASFTTCGNAARDPANPLLVAGGSLAAGAVAGHTPGQNTQTQTQTQATCNALNIQQCGQTPGCMIQGTSCVPVGTTTTTPPAPAPPTTTPPTPPTPPAPTLTPQQQECINCVSPGGKWYHPSDGFCSTTQRSGEPAIWNVAGCMGMTTGAATANPTFNLITAYVMTDPAFSITGMQTSGGSESSGGGMNPMVMQAIQLAMSQLPGCELKDPCFSVCSKEYTPPVGPAPTCNRGGPLIRYDEIDYFCGLGDCGPFAGKGVNVKIIGPNGKTAIDDIVKAGADGDFSYTFKAPAGDGEFTAIVSVPR